MELIELDCRNCGGKLNADDISEKLNVIRCPHCQSIYALKTDPNPTESAGEFEAKPTVEMPKGFTVIDSGRELEIIRRWFSPVHFLLLFFAIGWSGFMVVWHTISLSTGNWLMSLFGMIHTAVGIALLYSVAACFLNRTVLRVRDGVLSVRHAPLPWPGQLDLDAHSLKQLYAKEKVTYGKHGAHHRYTLFAIDEAGTQRPVLKSLGQLEQAVFLEQQIERFLRIPDQPVRGETSN